MSELHYKLKNFEGPLHLLLELIETEKLPISEVSLNQVTDQFLQHIEAAGDQISLESAVDFLHIASRLLYVKSRYVLSAITVSEEDGISLEKQLKLFKAYQEAAELLGSVVNRHRASFARTTILAFGVFTHGHESTESQTSLFLAPKGLRKEQLAQALADVLATITFITPSKRTTLEKVISIREKIEFIKSLIARKEIFDFRAIVGNQTTKTDVVVSFLALLELAKQRLVMVEQEEMFEEIKITKV